MRPALRKAFASALAAALLAAGVPAPGCAQGGVVKLGRQTIPPLALLGGLLRSQDAVWTKTGLTLPAKLQTGPSVKTADGLLADKLAVLLLRAGPPPPPASLQAAGVQALPVLGAVREFLDGLPLEELRSMPLEKLDAAARRLMDGGFDTGTTPDLQSGQESREGALRLPLAKAPPKKVEAAAVASFVPKVSGDPRRDSRVSLGRAWKHRFEKWEGGRLFKIPLLASDHLVLAALSFGLPTLVAGPFLGMLLLSGEWMGIGLGLVFALLIARACWIFAKPHVKEAADGSAVARGAKRWARRAGAAAYDQDLVRLAQKLSEEEGFEIVWTADSFVLAKPDLASRRVTMSVGWITASGRPGDRRRLAYLAHVFRLIRKAAGS